MRAVQGMVYALVKMIARPFTTIHLFLGQFIEQDVKVSDLLFIKEDCTVSKRVLILRTWSLIRAFLAFWVLIYISGSLFSLFWFHPRKECQFSLAWFRSTLLANFDFTYAYALIFMNRHFGSLFWLLRSLLGPYFTKKWVLIGSLSQSLGVLTSFGGSAFLTSWR